MSEYKKQRCGMKEDCEKLSIDFNLISSAIAAKDAEILDLKNSMAKLPHIKIGELLVFHSVLQPDEKTLADEIMRIHEQNIALKSELAEKDSVLEWIRKDIMHDRKQDVIVTKITEVMAKYKKEK